MENGRVNGAATPAWVGLRALVPFVISAPAYRMLKQRAEAAA